MPANLWVGAGYVEAGWIQSGITVDWVNSVVHVPKAVLSLVQSDPVEIRSMDADWFHAQLRALEETESGRPWSRTHDYNAAVQLSGITYALVMEVLAPYTITFEDGLWNVNIIGGNTNIGDRVNKNQVGVNTNNSAGLVGLVDLTVKVNDIHGQVTRSIHIDTELTVNGNGFQQTPYNNWSDAVDDAEANGIKHLILLSDATIDRQLKNFTVTGIGTPKLDFNGQNVDKSEFERCTLTGLYTGRIVAQDSDLTGTFNLNGFFENCAFGSNFIVPDNGIAFVKNCSAFVTGADVPIFDIGGVAGTGVLSMSGWAGPLKIINVNQPTDEANLAINISKAELDASCTDGTINVGGVIRLTDNSAGATVNNDVIDPQHFQNIITRLGLEKGNAWTDTPGQSGDASGNIVIQNTGDGENTSTATRQ